ncbi:hypothetical protein M407DRAFT_214944, partial [Tulasnella calospora MUT 4182]
DATCLPGTRQDVLKKIHGWVDDPSAEERVFYVTGMAGCGKSTIASTIFEQWKPLGSCAIYHYRRDEPSQHHRLVTALARQLANTGEAWLQEAIFESIRRNSDIEQKRLEDQFKMLLVNPLTGARGKPSTVLIVIDALDECHDTKYAEKFIELIHRHVSLLPTAVKFLVTSRPSDNLFRAFQSLAVARENLDSQQESLVTTDVKLLLEHKLTEIGKAHDLPRGWYDSNCVDVLARLSQGLFQWVSTAMIYCNEGSPKARLKTLLKSPSDFDGLDALYQQVLSTAFAATAKFRGVHALLLRTLGTLLAAPHSVSLDTLAYIYAEDKEIVANLTSLLAVPSSPVEPIRLMHASIGDFLTDLERCSETRWFVDLPYHHHSLALDCLRLMDRDLKYNICGLSDLTQSNYEIQHLVQKHVSQGLRYCARSWSHHLSAMGRGYGDAPPSTADVHVKFENFSQKQALQWLETMSLVGETQEAITMAKQAMRWVQVETFQPYLPRLWNDITRFVTEHFTAIAFGALHIYASALPTCPVETELWKRYNDDAMIRIFPGPRQQVWSPLLWTRSLQDWVSSVVLSPDGKTLASVSNDHIIRLWDAETGVLIGEPLTGHYDLVTCAVFSPDGKTLASGSRDGTVRLWNAETGSLIGEPLTGHPLWVLSVAFSPDSKSLASGCEDRTIRLWNAETGGLIAGPLRGHYSWVRYVIFSPDGKTLASGSDDATIRLWNAETGALMAEPLIGHSDRLSSVVFSPDGKTIVSGSNDKTIRLWNAETGAPIGEPLTGHDDQVTSVVISSDGKTLASGSYDYSVRLWNAETGALIGEPLTGHSFWVQCVVFSPDDKTLASASTDYTIRLWNVETGAPIGNPLTGHDQDVISLAFSLDGKTLASGSHDKTIRLWNVEMGALNTGPLLEYDSSTQCVAFSPDGKTLASGSYDGTIQLWNAETGALIVEPLRGHSGWARHVVFSPDGKTLASGSDDYTIRLWNAETGALMTEPLTGHSDQVSSVVFSPDGKTLASGSHDQTIRLWNAETGALIGEPLTGHSFWVKSVIFSPDGEILASGSHDNTTRLWNTKTGAPIGGLATGFDSEVTTVVFSPDGKALILEDVRSCDLNRAWSIEAVRGDTLSTAPSHKTGFPSSISVSYALSNEWVTYNDTQMAWLHLSTNEAEYGWRQTVRPFICGDKLAILDGGRLLWIVPTGKAPHRQSTL